MELANKEDLFELASDILIKIKTMVGKTTII